MTADGTRAPFVPGNELYPAVDKAAELESFQQVPLTIKMSLTLTAGGRTLTE